MAEQNTPDYGRPDAFARPGQAPIPVTPQVPAPVVSFPAPAADARPYSFSDWTPQAAVPSGPGDAAASDQVWPPSLGGATAVGGRRRSRTGRLVLAGLGALTALALVAGASGMITARMTSAAPQQTRPAASAPAQSGQATQPASAPKTTAPAAGTGTAQKSIQSTPTDAQSKGVVLINTTMTNGTAAGTGMVIDASGLVLTNYHVVQGSTAVKVTIATSGRTYTATVVGHDATNDVALLQLADASGLDVVTFDQDAVSVGAAVTAVGNANGQEYLTAASGQVTDTSATVTVSNDSASGTETLKDVYETNAAAQPGDSGGPLFDAQAEVTAMTTAGEQTYRGPRTAQAPTTTATYAIPIARALSIVQQIRSGHDAGSVRVGPNAYLGVMVATRSTGSAVVSQVTAGTPAAKAGLTAGSTITAIAGTKVASQADIAAALSGHKPGQSVKVAWMDAAGAAHTADVTLAASPVN